jgi:hypothetical protein
MPITYDEVLASVMAPSKEEFAKLKLLLQEDHDG